MNCNTLQISDSVGASDEQLAVAAKDGNRSCFDELVRRVQPRLIHALRQRMGSHDDAEDVAQEAVMRAWLCIERYEPKFRFTTWLYTIAMRMAVDHKRRRRATVSMPEHNEPRAGGASPLEHLHRDELKKNLWRIAAEVLNQEQQTMLWLRYAESMSVQEIARITDRTVVGVRVMLMRARQKLAPYVEGLRETDESSKTGQRAADDRRMMIGRQSTGGA